MRNKSLNFKVLFIVIVLFVGTAAVGVVGVTKFVLMGLSKAIGQVIENLTSEQLSEASTEQASSLEETVATIEEMTSMVTGNAADAVRSLAQRSAEAAKDIPDLIRESVEKIEKGGQQAEVGGENRGLFDGIESVLKEFQKCS